MPLGLQIDPILKKSQTRPAGGDPKKDRIVRLDLLTSREVGEWKRKSGDVITVGLTYRGRPDIELGLQILDALAEHLLPAVDALRRHKEYLRANPPRVIERQMPLPPLCRCVAGVY